MSKTYVKWLDRFLINWCTLEQLEKLVKIKQLTESEVQLMIKAKEEHEKMEAEAMEF
ncbi:MAG: hypothetical protein RR494_13460 [Vagococcus sp.]|uniref:hypothetical protein n=1 Tax=Vagococcus sp. TaxID=1933889 RepID=UPI002FC97B25